MSEGLSQEDFRRLLATPRRTNTEEQPKFKAPAPRTPREGAIFAKPRALHKKNVFKKPAKKESKESAEDQEEPKDVNLYRDRAAERRQQELETEDALEEEVDPKQAYEQSKLLGGDIERTHLVKGLDYALLNKVRSQMEGKDIEPEEEQDDQPQEQDNQEDDVSMDDVDQALDRFERGEAIATEQETATLEEKKPTFHSLMAKHIYEQIEQQDQLHKAELFEPGRMTFVFELADEVGHYSDAFAIPTAAIRSKADMVAKSGLSEENLAEAKMVLTKITQVLQNRRRQSNTLEQQQNQQQHQQKANIQKIMTSGPVAMGEDAFMGDIFADAGRDYYLDEENVKSTETTKENNKSNYFHGLVDDEEMKDLNTTEQQNNNEDEVNALLSKARGQSPTDVGEPNKKRKLTKVQLDDDAADIDMFGLSSSALPTSFDERQTAYESGDEDDYDHENNGNNGSKDKVPQMMDQGTNRNKKAQLTRWDFDTEEEWQKYKDTIEIHPKSAFQFGVKLSDGRRKNREKRKDMSEEQKLNREYQQVKNIMSKKYGTSFGNN
ncbi:Protein Red [Choanephora cucurbitarum]|uniref:Protein Red n=1 Tax=Choanephora cucurbitarum TaxID=101091 RepID=A0A1C7NMA4_9FUNG|nr:Protein Red [Choanephora cucurbitarum]